MAIMCIHGFPIVCPQLKWAYTGVVRPKLLYACMTWGNAINTLQQTKKLKALDRLAVRSTTTITKTTPQASVEVMIDLLPIELMVQKVGISVLPSQMLGTRGRRPPTKSTIRRTKGARQEERRQTASRSSSAAARIAGMTSSTPRRMKKRRTSRPQQKKSQKKTKTVMIKTTIVKTKMGNWKNP